MDELFEEKMKVVLNLIRTNSTAAEALNITQSVLNMAHAKQILWNVEYNKSQLTEGKTPKKTGTGA